MTTALPRVRPLALKRRAAAFDNPDWLFELKYDERRRSAVQVEDGGAEAARPRSSPRASGAAVSVLPE
jgi:hypothetical protein